MNTSELFLVAMTIIFTAPFLLWRLGRVDDFAPLVVVQILTGIALGPGALGTVYPEYYHLIFNPVVVQSLNGIAWWAVMLFVWIAGMELDLHEAWKDRRESGITAGLALSVPMVFGGSTALVLLLQEGWIGVGAQPWQFVLGIGMACAVTALPILVLFMEKLEILRQPIGQRILRYASMDDLAIWGVLALILMDWQRVGRQAVFLVGFGFVALGYRALMVRLTQPDRWYVGIIWLAAVGFCADRSGLHFMVGAFLAGAVMDANWFEQRQRDQLRHNVLLVLMPVFFLSTGLRTTWAMGGVAVVLTASALLLAAVAGKWIGVRIAGRVLGWRPEETSLIAWLLQTKALIMIIFVNVLLDRKIISDNAFTALLLMAVGSTVLSIPFARPALARCQSRDFLGARKAGADECDPPGSASETGRQ